MFAVEQIRFRFLLKLKIQFEKKQYSVRWNCVEITIGPEVESNSNKDNTHQKDVIDIIVILWRNYKVGI